MFFYLEELGFIFYCGCFDYYCICFLGLKKFFWRFLNWFFGLMWTTLYFSMGYVFYFVWRDGGGFDGDVKLVFILYGINLVLNWFWIFIFFGFYKFGLVRN